MNTYENLLSSLRQKVLFRIAVFLVALMVFGWIYFYNTDIKDHTLAIGVLCSLFAWSLVELWDLSVEVYCQCMDERIKFFRIVISSLSEMVDILKKNKIYKGTRFWTSPLSLYDFQKGTWADIQEKFLTQRRNLWEFSFENSYYCLTNEYRDIDNYLNRCYLLVTSCVFTNKNGLEENKKPLHREFIKIITHKENIIESLVKEENKWKAIDQANIKFTNIKLNCEEFEVPDEIIVKEGVKIDDIVCNGMRCNIIFAPSEFVHNCWSDNENSRGIFSFFANYFFVFQLLHFDDIITALCNDIINVKKEAVLQRFAVSAKYAI